MRTMMAVMVMTGTRLNMLMMMVATMMLTMVTVTMMVAWW